MPPPAMPQPPKLPIQARYPGQGRGLFFDFLTPSHPPVRTPPQVCPREAPGNFGWARNRAPSGESAGLGPAWGQGQWTIYPYAPV